MEMSWDKNETDKMAEAIMEKAGIQFVSEAEAIEILQQRIRALESALREIRDHPHGDMDKPGVCDFHGGLVAELEEKGFDPFIIGNYIGHRCCAEIARRALDK